MKKTALITGSSSGIGLELAHIHAANGDDLILVARRSEKLAQLKDDIEKNTDVKVHLIVKDLSTPDGPKEVFNEVKDAGLTVDYLINNAGFGGQGKFFEREWETDLMMINLNIVATAALTRLFLPEFVKRGSGRILNVSSTASLIPGPLQAVYFASKAFVTSFSNAVAMELAGTGVTVTALMPGATDTGFAKVAGLENTGLFKTSFTAKSVAIEGYKGMMNGKLDVYAGLTFGQKFMLGSIPFMPKKVVMSNVRKLQEIS
ncbi:MAG: SDR family oxidoreductase [Deltaproteobacteria bacterium]|nr:SDR family oxidoreductase [Deltaproteobacteria bacterium]